VEREFAGLERTAKFGFPEEDSEKSEKERLRQPAQPGQGQPAPDNRAVARGLCTPAKHSFQIKYTLWGFPIPAIAEKKVQFPGFGAKMKTRKAWYGAWPSFRTGIAPRSSNRNYLQVR
jgi:hypothetical protein